uniref:T-complex protein 1 subunit eta n=1 Tax=Chromera velia CCMP2878 TaxID=1169474 RepID=A0A0G4GYN7_9ALVE|eukprot:Cvel_5426.t1-p1 / transcript=Cvel_5426.t1 / gene=Cvel_5426 / organism=Chromera_velia_CCMP2878 / gene_product=T-complex protein 1 subunit eta, putative / transcript_product=T-complex protein 1 subunit eta, putative / location=Cvel_scaffold252:92131-95083(+) / protein_length=556 / sequence_SO=supercontig / SO=protein_coding / is_pseudo=false
MMQPNIILLKEGTDTSQGKAHILSNINACQIVVDIVKTTLGPRGMDKLIHEGQNVTVTNDGATVMKLLQIVHPAAKIMVDIAKSQDCEVGDGTTSVVVIAGELLREARRFIEDGLHPQIVVRGYRKAENLAQRKLRDLTVDLEASTDEKKTQLLRRCAETTLNSKLVSGYKEFFSDMIVQAVNLLGDKLERDMIGIKKITGGSVLDSMLVSGVAFKKTFSYAGFEQQPKKFKNPKILLLNMELELKAEKENAEVRIEKPEEYQSIVDAEWKIIYEKLDLMVQSGAQVVLSKLPIGDLATQYFADRDIFCAGRVEDSDMRRTARATGAQVQTTVNGVTTDVLGTCGEFEEVQLGSERFNLFKDCPGTQSATMILRGGAQQFLEEAERSLHDAIEIVRRSKKSNKIVGGGGSIEMELSRFIREYAKTVPGKEQLVLQAFGQALEVIPRSLATNSGLDSTEIMNKLRSLHNEGKDETRWLGVDCIGGGVCNCFEQHIWEPSLVKQNAIASATEAACLVLSIDETVRNPRSEGGPPGGGGGMRGRGGMMRGRGMRGRGGR